MKPTYDMIIAQQNDGICMDYGYLKTSSLHYSAAFENQQCAMPVSYTHLDVYKRQVFAHPSRGAFFIPF